MKEAELKHTVEQYLQIEQNLGRLVFNRQNSGEVLVKRGDRCYKVKLCQEGTPDFIVHKAGTTFYIEIKGDKTAVRREQELFALLLYNQGISGFVVRSFEELEKVIEAIKDKTSER